MVKTKVDNTLPVFKEGYKPVDNGAKILKSSGAALKPVVKDTMDTKLEVKPMKLEKHTEISKPAYKNNDVKQEVNVYNKEPVEVVYSHLSQLQLTIVTCRAKIRLKP